MADRLAPEIRVRKCEQILMGMPKRGRSLLPIKFSKNYLTHISGHFLRPALGTASRRHSTDRMPVK
jgi:hypothetical protein